MTVKLRNSSGAKQFSCNNSTLDVK